MHYYNMICNHIYNSIKIIFCVYILDNHSRNSLLFSNHDHSLRDSENDRNILHHKYSDLFVALIDIYDIYPKSVNPHKRKQMFFHKLCHFSR